MKVERYWWNHIGLGFILAVLANDVGDAIGGRLEWWWPACTAGAVLMVLYILRTDLNDRRRIAQWKALNDEDDGTTVPK